MVKFAVDYHLNLVILHMISVDIFED